MTQIKTGKQVILQVYSPINLLNVVRLCFRIPGDNLLLTLTRISHQFACRHRLVVCCQHVMIICSLYRHNRLRLMRPRLSFCRQRARAPSTRATAMLSVPVSSTGQAPAPASGTNLPGADLDIRRMPCAPWKAHIKNPARSSHQLVRNPG